MLLFKLLYFSFESILSLHSLKKLCARKLRPRSSYDNSLFILTLQKIYTFCNLCVRELICVAKHDTACIFNLVVEKFAKVLHIHLALHSVNNGCKAVKCSAVSNRTLGSLYNVGKLTNARGLDKYSVGLVLVNNLLECLGKIANERATDTT